MKAWMWFLVGGGLLTAVELALPGGSTRDLLYAAIAFGAVVAILEGVRRHRPERRVPWLLLAAGMAAWAVGDLLWWYLDYVAEIDPFPSVADVFYLAGYPLLIAAVATMSSAHRRVVGRSSVLDPLIIVVCVGLVLWVLFIEPTWTDPAGDLLSRLVGVAYPIGDVALLALVLHLGAASTGRRTTQRLLLLGFSAALVADLLFQATGYLAGFEEHQLWLDGAWLLGYVAWGAAALHPGMASPGTPRTMTGSVNVGRVVFLGAAVILLPGLILTEMVLGVEAHTGAVSVASVVLILLVLTRMIDLVRHMHDQARRLEALAATDLVTGLENRRRFAERLDELLTADRPEPLALALVTVQRLPEITETLGERTGDEVRHAVARRIVEAVETDGVVARTGADTFGVLLPGVSSPESVMRRAGELGVVFREPFALSEVALSLDGAIGVALAPTDASTAGSLLYRADVALSAAREHPDRVARYDGEMQADGTSAQLMTELPRAIEHGELVLHYQPQVDLTTGRVLGVEALVRWDHPEHGMLPPVAFIPAAERTGQIRMVTLFVLDWAVAQAAQWRAGGLDLTVSVNLSVRDLLDPRFVEDVRTSLAGHALPASALELELTETMAMSTRPAPATCSEHSTASG